MMIIFRAQDSKIMEHLRPHLLDEKGISEDVIARQVVSALETHPEVVFVQVAFEELENKAVLKAFLIAYDVTDRDHVFVHQAWGDVNKTTGDALMTALEEWTAELGRTHIRIETQRSPRAFAKRFGFKNFTQIMIKEIKKE